MFLFLTNRIINYELLNATLHDFLLDVLECLFVSIFESETSIDKWVVKLL